MSTPDDLETLLRRHDEELLALKRRRTIVPSMNPTYDSATILDTLEVGGDAAIAGALELGGPLTINGVNGITTADQQTFGTLTNVYGGYTAQLDGTSVSIAVTMDRLLARDYPQVGDRVTLVEKSIGGWHVTGRAWSLQYLQPINNWGIYDYTYMNPGAYKTYEGIVGLFGLISKGASGSIASGTVLAVLPVGYRPDYDLLVPVNDTDGHGRIVIRANGNIEVYGISTGSYISLSGVTFPAAGVATWAIVQPTGTAGAHTFANSWTNYTQSGYNFGPARLWQSPKSGVVFVQAVLAGGSTTSLTAMINLVPGSWTPTVQQIMQSVAPGNAYAGWRAMTNNTLVYEAGGNAGPLPVFGTYLTAAANSGDSTSVQRISVPATAGGWVDYDQPTYGTVVALRYQGISYYHGLVKSGPSGTSSSRAPQRWFYGLDGPDTTSTNSELAKVQSATGVGRMDLTNQGFLVPRNGSTSWFSFGGLSFVNR